MATTDNNTDTTTSADSTEQTSGNDDGKDVGQTSNIRQPANDSIPGQVGRLPGVRNVPVIGAGNPKRAEDHIPLQDAVRDEYAIRRDDGTYFGLVKVTPANMATVDDDQWEKQVERLASVLMANGNGHIQIYSPMRSVDFGDRQEVYREQSQERQLTGETAGSDVLADIADERASNVGIYEKSTLSRTHYVGLAVSELATTAKFTEDRGGLATVPVLGSVIKQREADSQRDDSAHAEAMCNKLTSRLDQLSKAIGNLTGVSATPLSSTRATQVIADHYGREDAFAYDDYSSLVRQAPLVYGEDDPEYEISHEYPDFDNLGGRATADGGGSAQKGQPGVSPQAQTVADVVRNDPNALSNKYKSLLAAKFDTSDPGHVRIDSRTLASTISVRNWPRVPTYGMFSDLLASSKPGVEIILSVHAERDESDDMDQDVLSLEQKWKKSEENESLTRERDKQKYETAKDINQTRKAPNKALFSASAYITIKSDVTAAPDDKDPVDWHDNTVASAKRMLKKQPANAGGVRVDHNQMEGLHSSAPILKDAIGETALMKDMGLASVFPWHARNLTDPEGVVVGQHRARDEPTVLDIFNRPTGYNMMIAGTIGSGKTTTLKELLSRHKIRNPDTTVVVIDPLQDFAGLTKIFDGERIVIGGDTAINPFHIEPTPEDVLREIGREIPFKTTVRQAKAFIETYYKLEGMDYESRKGTWEKAIKHAFEWAGITEDPDTHDRTPPTPMTAIHFIRDMANNPGNYVDEAVEDNEKAKHDRETTAIEILNNDIEPLKEGGEYHNLTKQTDIEDIDDTGFLYLDLQQYDTDQEAGGLMMQLLISQVYEQAKTSDNKTVTAFDEARYMFSNTSDLQFLRQIVRHSRHFDLSMIFSTQQMGDFFEEREEEGTVLKQSAKDIIDNSSMKIFHYNKEMNDEWGDAFDLTDAEQKYIKDAEPGEHEVGYSEALLQVDREGCFPIRVEMDEKENPREFALYRYDPTKHDSDLAAYLRQYDSICNWRWTQSAGFYGSPEMDTTDANAETELELDTDADIDNGTETGTETATESETEQEQEQDTTTDDRDEKTTATVEFTPGKQARDEDESESESRSPSPDNGTQPALSDIQHVADERAEDLRAAGYESVGEIAAADTSELAEIDGIGEARAETMTASASDLLGEQSDGAVVAAPGDDD